MRHHRVNLWILISNRHWIQKEQHRKAHQSFASSDCATNIFKMCFDLKEFSCAQTKCQAIIRNVFAPHVKELLSKDLKDCNYVTIYTDASNHGSTKLFPVVVRFFSPTTGVHVIILEFTVRWWYAWWQGKCFFQIERIVPSFARDKLCSSRYTQRIETWMPYPCESNWSGVNRLSNILALLHLHWSHRKIEEILCKSER